MVPHATSKGHTRVFVWVPKRWPCVAGRPAVLRGAGRAGARARPLVDGGLAGGAVRAGWVRRDKVVWAAAIARKGEVAQADKKKKKKKGLSEASRCFLLRPKNAARGTPPFLRAPSSHTHTHTMLRRASAALARRLASSSEAQVRQDVWGSVGGVVPAAPRAAPSRAVPTP